MNNMANQWTQQMPNPANVQPTTNIVVNEAEPHHMISRLHERIVAQQNRTVMLGQSLSDHDNEIERLIKVRNLV